MKNLFIEIGILLFLSNSVFATPDVKYEVYMSNAALQCPSIAAASSVVDSIHIGAAITPTSYASSYDLSMVLAHVLLAYCYVLKDNPDYNGSLEISFVSPGTVYAIFNTTALEARNAIAAGTIVDLLRTMVANGKVANPYSQTQYSHTPYKSSDEYGDISKICLNLTVRAILIHINPAAQAILIQPKIVPPYMLKDIPEKMVPILRAIIEDLQDVPEIKEPGSQALR